MEQINTDSKDFFSAMIANPAGVDEAHAPKLKSLVELYPQSGILKALLARAIQVYDQGGFQQKLKSAAVYAPDRAVLYNLINYPEKLVKYETSAAEVAEDEENHTFFENDYSTYQEEDVTENYVEEPVYEEEAVNYFHDPAEVLQYPELGNEAYNTLVPEETYQPEAGNGFYNYTTPEPLVEEPVVTLYNYDPQAYQEEELQQPVSYDSNYNAPAYPEEGELEQPAVYNYNTPSVYPEEEVIQKPAAYNYNTPSVYAEEEEEVIETPAYNYVIPTYQEEEQLDEPSAYDYDTPAYQTEPIAPPIPGYTNYQEEIVKASVSVASSEIDDEVYDEITGIEDIYIQSMQQTKPSSSAPYVEQAQTPTNNTEEAIAAPYAETENISDAKPDKVADEYILSASNFKDRMESSNIEDDTEYEMVDEPVEEKHAPAPIAGFVNHPINEADVDDDDSRVSKYNDDKMPYSFLWWLDKVRKEHAETHQPYVAFQPITTEVTRPVVSNELQQQYFENIFHLSSVEQLDIHTRDKRKESEIIDRFIQKDPQLKAPNTEKLDNENKAKQSSEDQDELVSETLARVYLDQMLYNKAILTYQKLLLKFPEKSSYFVAQIELLEKKIS